MPWIRVPCTALLILVCAQTAAAEITTKKAMWGPATVAGRSQFPLYADLGVGVWEQGISWRAIARRRPSSPRDPGDPAYRWPALDGALADAAAHGIGVCLLVMRTP